MGALVSIITIAFNCEENIGKTIESVLAQNYDKIEYLIIDGGSVDDTVKRAEAYRKQMEEKGVEFNIYSERDKGIYDAMNKGIDRAKGDYIGILNSGDWYERGAVQMAITALEKNGGGLAFGNIRIIKQDGSSFIKKAHLRKFQTSRDWNHPTMFVRAGLYKENPFLCKGVHDDYGFYLKMVKKGVKIIAIDKTLANFCMGGASNRKSLQAAKERIRDRYLWCYRINGFSKLYLVECILIEAVKWIMG